MTAIYRTIAEDLRSKIESGELAREYRRMVREGKTIGNPGEPKLASESDLMDQYEASRSTVREAIRLLVAWGLAETRHGKGTYLTQAITPLVTTLSDPDTGGSGEVDVYERESPERREATASKVRIELHEAEDLPKSASALQLRDGESAISRHQKRYIDDTPWSMQTSFYPMTLVERGAQRLIQGRNVEEGTMAYLEETLGIEQAGWRDTIVVRAPDSNETDFFKLPADGRVAVIETARTAYDQHGQPVRVTVTVYPADRNQFVAYFGDVPDSARPDSARPDSARENAAGEDGVAAPAGP
jgi:GntR family transcriptional regulator